jgi:aryl-alcohol dehydrogenase-like predicted oxidoreductase
MRTLFCEAIGRSVSVLGFGCASLGSRVSPAKGLHALHLAFEGGVTWYDVAPPYGDGQAEALLGQFLQGRRDQVAICTKVGIGRREVSAPKKLIRSFARPVVKAFPQLRAGLARMRRPTSRAAITADGIEASVVRSLRNLRTDYIDVLALHEPTPGEVTDPQIIEALSGVVAKGYVRALSVAGEADSISASTPLDCFSLGQTPDNPFDRGLDHLGACPDRFLVTHSIFGSGALERFAALLARHPKARERLIAIGYERYAHPSEILMDYALANNPNGVVLASMFSPGHITSNLSHASAVPNVMLADTVRMIVDGFRS